jgi:hypothetical protein
MGFLEILNGPDAKSFFGVPSGMKVVSIFLINLKLKITRKIPEINKINPSKELKSVDIGNENKSTICKNRLASKMMGGKLIFMSLI